MEFPTTPVLDNFNRADADSLGSNWSPGYGGYLGRFGIQSNQMDVYSQVSGYTQGYWNPATYGPNTEVYITVTAWGTVWRVNLVTKMVNPDSTTTGDGYSLTVYANGTMQFKRQDDSNSVNIGDAVSLSYAVADGDSYGLSYVDGTLYGWHRPVSTGVWYCAGSLADSTYQSQSGVNLFYVHTSSGGADGLFDNFGGGTIYVEERADQATSASQAADLQAYLAGLASTIASLASVADAQGYLESLASTLQSQDGVTDLRTMTEAPSTLAQSVSSRQDRQAYVQTVLTVAASADTVADLAHFVETLGSTAASLASVTDAVTLGEIVTSVASSASSLADVQAFVDSLGSAAAGISSLTDRQLFADNVVIMAISQASLSDIQAYVASVATAASSASSLADVLVGAFVGSYLQGCAVLPRDFTETTPPRAFMAAVAARSFTTEAPGR